MDPDIEGSLTLPNVLIGGSGINACLRRSADTDAPLGVGTRPAWIGLPAAALCSLFDDWHFDL
jgi:hypothetical protein